MKTIDEIIYKEPRKTFMEIMKVHKQEVPFANLLGFFFRPKEKHGLGTLFLEALLNTKCSDIGFTEDHQTESIVRNRGYKLSGASSDLHLDSKNIKVDVEQKTEDDKRIDILIHSDDFVICIEFKINHDLDNPLDNYKAYVEKYHAGKQHHFIVLTPYKKAAIGTAKSYFDNNTEFKQVILSHFFNQIQIPASYITENEHNEYFRNFCDLVQTVDNRKIRSKRFHALQNVRQKLCSRNLPCLQHQKYGGFLEIKLDSTTIKVRIKTDGWQVETWIDKENYSIRMLSKKDMNYENLVETILETREIKAYQVKNNPSSASSHLTNHGYCPECQMKGEKVELLLNGDDLWECYKCHLQLAIKNQHAIVMQMRGLGRFPFVPDYGSEFIKDAVIAKAEIHPDLKGITTFNSEAELKGYLDEEVIQPLKLSIENLIETYVNYRYNSTPYSSDKDRLLYAQQAKYHRIDFDDNTVIEWLRERDMKKGLSPSWSIVRLYELLPMLLENYHKSDISWLPIQDLSQIELEVCRYHLYYLPEILTLESTPEQIKSWHLTVIKDLINILYECKEINRLDQYTFFPKDFLLPDCRVLTDRYKGINQN